MMSHRVVQGLHNAVPALPYFGLLRYYSRYPVWSTIRNKPKALVTAQVIATCPSAIVIHIELAINTVRHIVLLFSVL
jgi:hypothetical protein